MRIGGLILFYDTTGPLSSRTLTRSEVPKGALIGAEVQGRACQHGLSVPTAASLRSTNISGAIGKGGFEKALERIHDQDPGIKGLFDVKTDVQIFSILGVYKRQCIEVTARAFR